MKVSEALQYMSKSYMHRIIDSFTKDFPKPDQEKARQIILRNLEELTDPRRIIEVLNFNHTHSENILVSTVLDVLVNSTDCSAPEEEIYNKVVDLEKNILALAKESDSLKYEDSKNLEILSAVLEVALEDEKISKEEILLIKRLRKKLKISERNARILMAKLNHYPQTGNELHTISQIKEILKKLQKKGVVFYCNQLEGGTYLVPDEIVNPVKNAMGIELSDKGRRMMLDALSKEQLSTILESKNLPKSGTKDKLQGRIIVAGILPSDALESLSNEDLYNICSSLPGAKVSGTKQERLDRIIEYFANLLTRDVSDEASPGEIYYEYLVELATRDRENLLANKIIKKDLDMERAFEEGTRYLFHEKLGLELIEMQGSDNPDGAIYFGKNDELFMWDNKSKESDYTFPGSHVKQFKRYIRDSKDRVSCFLVIVPKVKPEAARVARKLKVESGTDTDVALITAEDLKWLAEKWHSANKSSEFNLHVFNITGILTRQELEEQMATFL